MISVGLGLFIAQPTGLGVLRPVFATLPTISGTTAVGDVLTATYGTATASEGGGAVSYAGQWNRDGVAISGATALTYTLVQADAGTTVSFTSTATDSNASTDSTVSVSIGEWVFNELATSVEILQSPTLTPLVYTTSGLEITVTG